MLIYYGVGVDDTCPVQNCKYGLRPVRVLDQQVVLWILRWSVMLVLLVDWRDRFMVSEISIIAKCQISSKRKKNREMSYQVWSAGTDLIHRLSYPILTWAAKLYAANRGRELCQNNGSPRCRGVALCQLSTDARLQFQLNYACASKELRH